MTDHDRRTLERFSRGEISLAVVCATLGLLEPEIRRWMQEAGLPWPREGRNA